MVAVILLNWQLFAPSLMLAWEESAWRKLSWPNQRSRFGGPELSRYGSRLNVLGWNLEWKARLALGNWRKGKREKRATIYHKLTSTCGAYMWPHMVAPYSWLAGIELEKFNSVRDDQNFVVVSVISWEGEEEEQQQAVWFTWESRRKTNSMEDCYRFVFVFVFTFGLVSVSVSKVFG